MINNGTPLAIFSIVFHVFFFSKLILSKYDLEVGKMCNPHPCWKTRVGILSIAEKCIAAKQTRLKHRNN